MVRKAIACSDPLKKHNRLITSCLRRPSSALLKTHQDLLTSSSWLCSQCRKNLIIPNEPALVSPSLVQTADISPSIPSGSTSSTCSFIPTCLKERKQDAAKDRLRKQINRLRVQLCRSKKQYQRAKEDMENVNLSAEDLVKQLSNYFDGQKLQFLSSQIRLANRKGKGKRYTETDKKIALALYLKSPQAYRLLSKMFSLPSTRSLARWKETMKTSSGFNSETLQMIRLLSKGMTTQDKIVVLTFDEMQVKKGLDYDLPEDRIEGFVNYGDDEHENIEASQALTFMVHGLTSRMKIPLAYFFTGPWSRKRSGTKGRYKHMCSMRGLCYIVDFLIL